MPSETRLHLNVTLVGDVAVVGFADQDAVFQPQDVQEFNNELHRLVETEGRTKILLNLNGINYLSSGMLGQLIKLNKKIAQAHGKLKLCCLTASMRDTFRVSKLDTLFEIHPDEAAALERF